MKTKQNILYLQTGLFPISKVRQMDQENLYAQVTWCILGKRGLWQKLSKEMNYKLEKEDVNDGIMDAQGVKWTVDLRNMVAKESRTRKKTKLKRLENHSGAGNLFIVCCVI